MPTRTSPRLRLLYIAVLLLLSGCGADPAGPAAPSPTALPATLPPPAGIWLHADPPAAYAATPPQPTPTRTPWPPTATPAPPTVPVVFTPPAAGQVLIGTWGSGDFHLTANSLGGAMAFRCAEGRLKEPLRLDAHGHFDVPGTYLWMPGEPQPTPPVPIPARYQGQVIGSMMVLTLTLFYTKPYTSTYHLTFVSAEPTYVPPPPCA